MTIDYTKHLGAVSRSVQSLDRDGKPARAVTLSRLYDTDMADLWDALTNPARLPRWFAPVAGTLEQGGRFRITGNASGTITTCDPPRHFALTWEFGDDTSWVDVGLTAETDKTRLTLTHTAHPTDHWEKFGPGAVGVGWDLSFLGMALYLADPNAEKPDAETFHLIPEGRALIEGSAAAWGAARIAAGDDPQLTRQATENTRAFYTAEDPKAL